MPNEEMLGTLFGTILVAALSMVIVSRCLHLVRRVITPLVTGIVVTADRSDPDQGWSHQHGRRLCCHE